MTSSSKILYEAAGGAARITLNRPEKRNALDAEIISGLHSAFERASADDAVRVVALGGTGRDFCSGADLAELEGSLDNPPGQNLAAARTLADLFLRMRRHRCPIVALVRGRALAGGCGLASACDIVLSEESAPFGSQAVTLGFIPAMVMAILRRAVTKKRAFEWIVSGEIFPAAMAREAGLVNQVFPDAAFEARANAYLKKLSAKPPEAVMLTKRLLYHTDMMSFESALETGAQANVIARMTEDCRAGLKKFLKKSGR